MDCYTFPELSVDEWGQTLLEKLRWGRYPLGGMFELTNRCNLSCVHCYINEPSKCQTAREKELTTAEIKHILDQLVDAGCLFLVFTGGEPLIRNDFPEIFQYARGKGIIVSLFTNGTMVTPQIADMLAEWRVQSIEVTLYGASQDTYDQVTRVPGAFRNVQRGIGLMLERGLPLSLKSVLLTINLHELHAMQEYAKDLGVNFHYDGMLFPRIDGSRAPLNYQISMDDLLQFDIEDAQRQKEWKRLADKYKETALRSSYVYHCGAGLRTFHIDSEGMLSMCTMARQPAYDLRKQNFSEAWNKLGDSRRKERKLHTPCETCEIRAICMQCPAWSQAVHGDDETPVEFICKLSHLRANVLENTFIMNNEEIINYEQKNL